VRVVYIAGWMRSGTTLLGQVLGAQPGVLNAGEVSGIWAATARGGSCSCGEPLTRCPIWGAAIAEVDRELNTSSVHEYRRWGDLTARMLRTRNAPRLMRWAADPSTGPAEFEELRDATGILLQAALREAGADVLVDSSKLPPGLFFHLSLRDPDVRIVQILRDPRAVAASDFRTRDAVPGNEQFVPPGSGLAKSLLRWYGANASVCLASRVLRLPSAFVRYEDLVRVPADVLKMLTQRLDLPFDSSTVRGDRILLPSAHAAVGNPSRSGGGSVTLTRDDRWRTELSIGQRAVVNIGAAPGRLLSRAVAARSFET